MELDAPSFVTRYVNLATPRLGAEGLFATDEFFAPLSRMLNDAPAVFIPDKYDDNGKWMDGWETRRRRSGGHDHCIVKLGTSGRIRGVDIDTSHFTGNYAPGARISACSSAGPPDENTFWMEIVPEMALGPSAHHYAEVSNDAAFTHIKLEIFPDGGVARLRVYGEPVPTWDTDDGDGVHELSALKNGGRIIAYNDAHYGRVWTLLTEGRGRDMGDGWETRRRREPGHDWIIIALGAPGLVVRIEVDTAHYKGNFADRCSLQAGRADGATKNSLISQAMFWPKLMDEKALSADTIHEFSGSDIADVGPVSHVRLNIHPDGGVSRFRVFGTLV